MLFPRITDLLPRIDLPDPVLGDVIAEAQEAARDRSATPKDCDYRWHSLTDRDTRGRWVLWRVTFRGVRERIDGTPVASTTGGRAANLETQLGVAPSD